MKFGILTDIQSEEDVLVEENVSKKLIVYNDDYNTFQHVIRCLIAYCKHTREQAEQCAMFIHNKGKYAVKHGEYEELRPIRDALTENGIDAKIE
jgi:ATP-dependent Clp protease adaptor protein ClpS